jgi:L-rhamnose mutarotase
MTHPPGGFLMTMRQSYVIFLAALAAWAQPGFADEKPAMDTRLYELRIYTAAPGKFDALVARFKDHTVRLLEKHGITNVGYFIPVDNKDNKFYFILAYQDRETREKQFKAFVDDAEWKKAFAESEKDGKLVTSVEQHFLSPTDYSPLLKIGKGEKDRVFELRIYTATAGNLPGLNDRFRNHTIKLFSKYGMTNLIYWNLAKGEKNADKMLIYLLAHDSVDAAKKSFDGFRKDPDWITARTASEAKAGGSLTEPKGGVVSIFLKPTEFSPLK